MYCVYFTIYKGTRLPPFYVGSTKIAKIARGYHGSVSSALWGSIWKQEIRENPHLFMTLIIPGQIRHTAAEILDLELAWQEAFDVVDDISFINQAFAKAGFCSTPESARKAAATRKRHGLHVRTQETKRKIGAANRGRKLPPVTPDTRAKLSQSLTGIPRTPEWLDKMSKSHMGKRPNEETRAKLRIANRRKQTPESIAKRLATIQANGGYQHSAETKRKIGEANKGKPRAPQSAESNEKRRNANLGRKRSPEAMAKYRATIAAKKAGTSAPAVQ
jgi:NUMOD3 motif